MVLPTHIAAVGGLVVNRANELLLVKNPRKGWEYPGGIVEPGETLPQGLIREIREESGGEAEVINIVGIYSNTQKKKGYNGVKEIPTIMNVDFLCRYLSGELTTSEESTDVRWSSRAEALDAVNPRQRFRFLQALKALDGGKEFPCFGFHLDGEGKTEISEEYRFQR